MKVLFHSNQLGERGTEVAMFDYAYYAKYNSGIDCYIAHRADKPSDAYTKFADHFKILTYTNFDQVESYIDTNKIDWLYAIKGGKKDGVQSKYCKNFMHVVFQRLEPHGDKYCFISNWLAKKMGYNTYYDYLPFIVTLPNVKYSLREEYSIPKDAIVIGRHGGYDEFNIPFVYEAIKETLNKNVYYIFLNTRPFFNHPNIIYLNKTTDRYFVRRYIETCDFMLHARVNGESFGLAIAEFLYCNKPVITCPEGMDQAHVDMCKDKGIYYLDKDSLKRILTSLPDIKKIYSTIDLTKLVSEYSPSLVNLKFEDMLYDKTIQ